MDAVPSSPALPPALPPVHPRSPPSLPRWDAERRELTYAGRIVKRYRCPAPRQIAILAAFEEEGWPYAIDDPLPPKPEIVIKDRLKDAVRQLNRNQLNRLIRFRGDGTGERVTWEPMG